MTSARWWAVAMVAPLIIALLVANRTVESRPLCSELVVQLNGKFPVALVADLLGLSKQGQPQQIDASLKIPDAPKVVDLLTKISAPNVVDKAPPALAQDLTELQRLAPQLTAHMAPGQTSIALAQVPPELIPVLVRVARGFTDACGGTGIDT